MTLFLRIASLYLAIDFFKLAIAGLYHANKSQNCEFVSRNDDKIVRIASLYHAMMIKSQKKKIAITFLHFQSVAETGKYTHMYIQTKANTDRLCETTQNKKTTQKYTKVQKSIQKYWRVADMVSHIINNISNPCIINFTANDELIPILFFIAVSVAATGIRRQSSFPAWRLRV